VQSLGKTNLCLVGVLFGTAVTAVSADQVLLDNGDRITGQLLNKGTDSVIIKTPYAGELKIKRARVSSITTDQPVRIQLHDGQQVDGRLQTAEDGSLYIDRMEQAEIPLVGLDAIATIEPVPSDQPPEYRWRGNVTVAGERQSGNTDTHKLNFDARAVAERKSLDRFTLSAFTNREQSDNKLTTEQYRLGGKYDRFFAENWYGYVGAAFEQDKFKDLDLRSVYSVGAGHQFYDTDELRVSLESGLSYTMENFIEDEDNNYAGLNWGFNWEQAFLDKRLNFFHRHRGNQGFDSGDNLIINASTGVRVPILDGLKATAQYDIDYDRSPPDDAESTDHTYLFGVGYDW
jgi:putative salt-induced outer membrane protein YdiY